MQDLAMWEDWDAQQSESSFDYLSGHATGLSTSQTFRLIAQILVLHVLFDRWKAALPCTRIGDVMVSLVFSLMAVFSSLAR